MRPDPDEMAQLARAAQGSLERVRELQEGASEMIAPVLEIIEQRLLDPDLNVGELVRLCRLRNKMWIVAFRLHTGSSPKDFLSQHRLSVAARLLVDTDLKIWRIAELVGYSSIGVFSKAFARVIGLRPRRYRLRYGGSERPATSRYTAAELLDALEGRLDEEDVLRLILAIVERYPALRESIVVAPGDRSLPTWQRSVQGSHHSDPTEKP